uniref:Uncharacterized protein n=1 Tax=viral metagenome TaxID=1070528 RepID=A0A6C0D6G3_9ZZZZ
MWQQPLYEFSAVCFRLVIIIVVGFIGYTNFNGRSSGYIVIATLAFLYLFTFFMGREYLRENFEESNSSSSEVNNKVLSTNEFIVDTTNPPYETQPINSLDDYEHNLVFQNENDREITKELRNKLSSQYPMDWSTQPASSSYYQKGLKEMSQTQQTDISGVDNMYKNVSGENLVPPDTDSVEKSERKNLQQYKAKGTKDLKTTYDIDDAYSIIKKMYDAKGLDPQIEHKKDTNIYEIIGVRKKGEKVLYEDELGDASASNEAVRENQESVTVVPQAATDLLYDSDPFYNKQQSTRTGKWDYTKYTPELERQFAPTYPLSQWY